MVCDNPSTLREGGIGIVKLGITDFLFTYLYFYCRKDIAMLHKSKIICLKKIFMELLTSIKRFILLQYRTWRKKTGEVFEGDLPDSKVPQSGVETHVAFTWCFSCNQMNSLLKRNI